MMSKFNEASDSATKLFQKHNLALFVNASSIQNTVHSNAMRAIANTSTFTVDQLASALNQLSAMPGTTPATNVNNKFVKNCFSSIHQTIINLLSPQW
jgi:hypothetical protein